MQDCGANTFLDAHDLFVGDIIQESIFDEHMPQSQEILVLMTPSAFKSKYVFMEIGAARVQKMRISVILYGVGEDEVQTEIKFPDVISTRNFLEINQMDDYLRQLKQRLYEKY